MIILFALNIIIFIYESFTLIIIKKSNNIRNEQLFNFSSHTLMFHLLEERERLKNKIKEKRKLEKTAHIIENTNEKEKALQNYQRALESLQRKEEISFKCLKKLQKKVQLYKNEQIDKLRENIRESIIKYMEEINSWNVHGIKEYKRTELIAKRANKLPNFRDEVLKIGRKIKHDIIQRAEYKLDNFYDRQDQIVDLLIILNDIRKVEILFEEEIFITTLYSKMYDEFSFHFFTQKQTNRLDKPEWYFKFLLDKLKSYKFLCKCYDRIVLENQNVNVSTDLISENMKNILKKNEPQKNEKSINVLINKIYSILEIKINELKKCQSNQKRNLFFHFTEEFLHFKNELKKNYLIDLNIIDLPENILSLQKDHIIECLHSIQTNIFSNCFKNYEKIYKENFLLAFSYVSLQNNIFNELINFITTSIIKFIDAIVDEMTFNTDEQKDTLCMIVVGLDELKNFLRIEECVFLEQIEGKTDCNTEILKNIHVDTSILGKFNNQNIKLLQTVIFHDVSQILVNFIYLNAMTNQKIMKYCSMIAKIISGIFQKLGKHKIFIENHIFDKIDNFIVEKIVLQNTFNSELLFVYKDFIDRIIKLSESYREWKCLMAFEHLKDIFNGVDTGDELFEQIYKKQKI